MLLVDITRLLRRIEQASPTGIDRVEFEYARHYAEGATFVCHFGDRLVRVPKILARKVVSYLDDRWSRGAASDAASERFVGSWKRISAKQYQNPVDAFHEDIKRKGIRARYAALWAQRAYFPRWIPPRAVCATGAIIPAIVKIGRVASPGDPSLNVSGTYLNVGHFGLDDGRLMKGLAANKRLRKIFYLHDILPVTHPELYGPEAGPKHEAAMRNLRSTADVIVSNSRYTGDGFSSRYGRAVDAVVEIGSPERSASYEGERSGFVSIGTFEPRKNFLWLARTWLAFCRANPAMVGNERLTIFGKVGWLSKKDLAALNELAADSPHLELIHGASDAEIARRLGQARAYVSAAVVEGWGMPLTESLAAGTQVIATDIEAHREATQGCADFFPIGDQASLSSLFTAAYDAQALRARIILTQAFQPWTWESHFSRVDGLLTA